MSIKFLDKCFQQSFFFFFCWILSFSVQLFFSWVLSDNVTLCSAFGAKDTQQVSEQVEGGKP